MTRDLILEGQSRICYRSLVEHTPDVLTVVDDDSLIRYQSPSVELVLGCHPTAWWGRSMVELVHPEDAPVVAELLKADRRGQAVGQVEFRWRHADGSWPVAESAWRDLRHDPVVAGVVLHSRDITARKAAERALWHRALHDPLTGLANRALFHDRLENAIERCRRGSAPPAVLFLDLNDFKPINDRLGHDAGDAVLVELGRRLRRCVRAADTVARLGGDEFAILIEEIDSPELAAATVERILADLRAPLYVDGRDLAVTASIGLAIGSSTVRGPDELLRRADTAMYRAKRARPSAYRAMTTTCMPPR
jgi:diguanylate cyclase (GGDEF)-like protein/PAS domain S-box-containing protein